MKTREEWGRHLREFVNKSLDPVVYAVQWAREAEHLRAVQQHHSPNEPLGAGNLQDVTKTVRDQKPEHYAAGEAGRGEE